MRPANVNKTKDTARPQGWTKTRDRCSKVSNNARGGRTDGQTDRQTECDAICGPLLKQEGRIIMQQSSGGGPWKHDPPKPSFSDIINLAGVDYRVRGIEIQSLVQY